ncbi:MAG TPA: multicopper oxidase domain-containing protein [Gemmatimonadaceae bacterium]
MISSLRSITLPVFGLLLAGMSAPRAPETISPNDNRHTAGTLANGVLTIKLETRTGVWHPEGENGRAIEVAAWSEEGKALSTPGPVIRVPVGTEVHATVHNTFDQPLRVFGLGETRGLSDSVVVAPNATRSVQFKATTPGTYYYTGKRADGPFGLRANDDTQLNGVIVVDPANTRPNDRVFVISWWFTLDSTSETGLGRATMTINGLSWPHTERIDVVQGDSVHWRVINLTEADHPMHLHGFYFRMESKGNGVRDSLFDADAQRLGVTEVISPFQTMSFSWKPTQPGNWIYHCHYADHLSQIAELDTDKGMLDESMLSHHMSDRPHQMFGLVLGIHVTPHGTAVHSTGTPRAIRLTMREKANIYGKHPGYSFVMDGTPEAANPDAMPVPAPALILQKGQPVAITIVNHANDRAAVHWHGIELESYPDGVPGWSGSDNRILPSVGPGDSITVRFAPPRAGTFMYHSHFNEAEQISSGLYGPIIVLEPGQKFDPEMDRVLIFGAAGPARNVVVGPFPHFLMNGKEQPEPMDLKAGTRYRFRLINISDNMPLFVSLTAGDTPVTWRAVAKDGATLPDHQATSRPATLLFDPGEIYDFEFTPRAPGDLTLRFGPTPPPPGSPPPPPGFPPPPPTINVAVHVK